MLAATLVAGTVVIAQRGVQRVTVPTVTAPSATVPSVAAPRAAQPRGAQPAPEVQGPIAYPVMPPELIAAHIEAAEKKLSYLPGRVLVKFRRGVGRQSADRVLGDVGIFKGGDTLEWIGDLAIVKDRSEPDTLALVDRINAHPDVEYAQPDYLQRIDLIPNDPSYTVRQWNMTQINAPRAWDIVGGGSSNVIVAVVDTGVTPFATQNVTVQTWSGSAIVNHTMPVGVSPDFSVGRFISPRDFTVTPATPGTVVIDSDGHGSHVAGTVGEDTNNGIALAGVAYNARIMPLKACTSYWDLQFARSAAGIPGFQPNGSGGTCPTSATTAAIRYAADNGAKVLNYSIGGTSQNQAVLDAMNYAVGKGVFIAMSNGNTYISSNNALSYPAAYAPTIRGGISVAATNRVEQHASYSTTGNHTEIAAPGGDGGDPVWQASIRLSDSNEFSVVFPRFDRYDERGFTGTSMASPHVAGVAALLVSRGVTDPAAIEAILKASARDIASIGRDDVMGFGVVQPFRALTGMGIRR